MTTELGSVSASGNSAKSPRQIFYGELAQALNDGGFDRHMSALCKPFIANATGPTWWTMQPSCYFRLLFVGYLEGIESERELCWLLEESLLFRQFIGFDVSWTTPDPATLVQLRQPLLPLIHSEAFDTLLRILEKTGIIEGRLPQVDAALLNSEPIASLAQRIRSKDHQNYWKRLIKMPGASWAPRSSIPPVPRTTTATASTGAATAAATEPFALWVEDLSLAHAEIIALKARGVADFAAHFAQHDSPAVDHVVRACIYGRGPSSVRAVLSSTQSPSRELPQQLTADSLAACRAMTVALAEGHRQFGMEVPLLDADGQPATVSVQLAVQPGFEETLGNVLVAFTDITQRRKPQTTPTEHEPYVEAAVQRSRIGVWEWDMTSDVTRWSDAMLRIYGVSRQEFTGKHSDYVDFTYPDDREVERDSVRQSIVDAVNPGPASRAPVDVSPTFADYRIRRRDGQIRWVRGSAVELLDDQGRPVKMHGVLWDVTRTKQAEQQLAESEQRFRSMVENAALPIVVEAFDGELLYANDSALTFFEIGRDELTKLRATDYWEDPEQRAQATSTLAERGELRGFEARFKLGTEHEPRVALMAASVIEYGGRNVILCHHQEITFSKCIEEQLRAAQQQTEEQLRSIQQQAEEQSRVMLQQREEQSRNAEQTAERMRQLHDEQTQLIRDQLEGKLHDVQERATERERAAVERVTDTLATRSRELQLMKEVSAASEGGAAKLLEVTCRELAQAFELPLALAATLGNYRSELGVVAAHGPTDGPSLIGNRLLIGPDSLRQLFTEHPHPVWISSVADDERAIPFRGLFAFEPQASCLLLPLLHDQTVTGLLLLGTGHGRTFDADALGSIRSVVTLVNRGLSMMQLDAKLRHLTATVERVRAALDDTDLDSKSS